jgi:pilus assembly protein CpaF
MKSPFGHRLAAPPPVDQTRPAPAESALAVGVDPASAPSPKDRQPAPTVQSTALSNSVHFYARVAEQEAASGQVMEAVRDLVLRRLDPIAAVRSTDADLRADLERMVGEAANEHGVLLNTEEQHAAALELMNDIAGLGPLEPLLHDDDTTDILVNGAGQIFIEQHGMLELTDVKFRSDAHVMHVGQRIATLIDRRVDRSSPMLDARLPDGSRVNVIFPPVSVDGPCISIRKFSRGSLRFDQMIGHGSLSPTLARFLEIVTRCRLNIIISGGTGSGKTTLLAAMSRYIDPRERVITIEDSVELQLQLPHRVRLETRPPGLEGEGEITQRDLVRNALRMRPDRIIVGEVRGTEAFDMLQAMNTGHRGSMSTIHANSPRDALTRIENMVLMATANLPSRAIMAQIAGALQLVVQVERMRDGARRVVEVAEIVGVQGDVHTLATLFSYRYEGESEDGVMQGTFAATGVRPSFLPRIASYGLNDALMETLA